MSCDPVTLSPAFARHNPCELNTNTIYQYLSP